MTAFPQASLTEQAPAIYTLEPTGRIAPTPDGPTPAQPYVASDQASSADTWTASLGNKSTKALASFPALEIGQSSGGFDWFETFHVVPRSFAFGNLLSDQSSAIEVFSAFRRLPKREWTSFTNNAGAGVNLGGEPSLPVDVDPLTGIVMTLDVSTAGDPFVDATLDFFFTGVGTALVPITIQRIVLWGKTPEQPFSEVLSSLTDVFPAKAGKEKRHSLRKNPRQSWEYEFLIDEGEESQILENLLFDFQHRTFGVPVWFEDSTLTAAVTAGDTTITVDSTDYRDYRVGGRAVIFTDQGTFDVLEIASGGISSTTLTFTSAATNSYVVGTKVFPLAVCRAPAVVEGGRWPVTLRRLGMRFEAVDNDVDLADISPFSSYNSKLLLDNGNSMLQATVRHTYRQNIMQVDGGAGLVFQDAFWDRHKRGHQFTLRAEGRQAVWEMRGLAHALKGRWISFYVPTDADDLIVVANLVSAADTMDVQNVGYTQFVRDRQPKDVIRVNFVDGSTPLLRGITGSASPSSTVDQLTLDGTWPSTITPAEISRVEYVEKVRLDTDDVRIEYDSSGIRARLVAPVVAVFE